MNNMLFELIENDTEEELFLDPVIEQHEWFLTLTVSKSVMDFSLEKQIQITDNVVKEFLERIDVKQETRVWEVTKQGNCHWHLIITSPKGYGELEKIIKQKLRVVAFREHLGYVFDLRAVWDREYLEQEYFVKQKKVK